MSACSLRLRCIASGIVSSKVNLESAVAAFAPRSCERERVDLAPRSCERERVDFAVTAVFRFNGAVLLLVVLVMAGVMLCPLREHLRKAAELQERASGAANTRQSAARWINVAIPGGLRALAADGLWLRLYGAWAARDLPRTELLIRLVTIVDERPLNFWINGARIIAYDMSEWRLSSCDGGRMPAEVRRRIVEEQASAALRHLEAAFFSHPDNAAVWVEMGNIQLYRRGDLALAAGCYRRAAEAPVAPYFAGRIYGELLRRLGRDQDAYDWLRRVHPRLPVDDEAAMAGLVLRRIRDLERRLKVPVREQYMPAREQPGQ